MPSKLRVGVSQSYTRPDLESTLSALRSQTALAAQQSIAILTFPEAFLGGYPRTCSFGASIGAREPFGRDQYLAYLKSAVDLGDTFEGAGDAWVNRTLSSDPNTGRRGDGTRELLESIAEEYNIFLVVGVIEKVGSSLFCSAVYLHPTQGTIAKRRKVQPTGTERLVWAQGSPSTLKAVATTINGVRVVMGTAICWENYMPLLRYALYAQGVNLWLAPTADGRDTWAPLMRTIAQEGRCFVLSANQCQKYSDLPSWATSGSQTESSTITNTAVASSNAHSRVNKTHDFSNPTTAATTSATSATIPNGAAGPSPSELMLQRRVSITTKTDDGAHEIAWRPSSAASQPPPPPPPINESPTSLANKPDSKSQIPSSPPTSYFPPQSKRAAQTTDLSTSPSTYVSRGGSLISSPLGEIIAGPSWDEQDSIISAEVDFEDCERGKLDFDVAGHYARSDVFELKVKGLDLIPPP